MGYEGGMAGWAVGRHLPYWVGGHFFGMLRRHLIVLQVDGYVPYVVGRRFSRMMRILLLQVDTLPSESNDGSSSVPEGRRGEALPYKDK